MERATSILTGIPGGPLGCAALAPPAHASPEAASAKSDSNAQRDRKLPGKLAYNSGLKAFKLIAQLP